VDWQERIVIDPKILLGKPVIRGTRIAVEFLMQLLAENYPQLTPEDIQAALHYAAEALKEEQVFRLAI
jgi:uncharacterized protein (DUF433 family)